MENNEELDLVEFLDENDNKVTMEVIDYFFYEGTEYAVLTEYTGKEKAEDDLDPEEVAIMAIHPVGEDEEEFVPVDEKLGQKLFDLYTSGAFEGDFDDGEEDE